MAETSYLWEHPGTGDSPVGGYSDAELMNVVFRMLLNGTGNQGVLRGWLNELLVTDGGGLSVNVATGGAIVYGFWYENDAVTNIVVPNNTTVAIIVHADWATFTARLTHDNGAGLVQNPGVVYDIPVANVTTVAGAVTVVDTTVRDYCEFSSLLPEGGVTTASIQNNAITTTELENHTKWITVGLNELYADGTNPATLTYGGASS